MADLIMKPAFLIFTITLVLSYSCTLTMGPNRANQPSAITEQATGSLKIIYKTDTVISARIRLYTEATYTSLSDQRIPLVTLADVKPIARGIIQFEINDLNPGNYIVDISAHTRISGRSRSGVGHIASVQVTAGKHREYNLATEPSIPAYAGRIMAESALKKIVGFVNCTEPTESIYVNKKYPESIEKFDPFAERVFGFESSFQDTVYVYVDDRFASKTFLSTSSNGSAGQLRVKASAGSKVSLRTTPNDCVEFRLKDGYKYLYINRYPVRKWDIAYSNFSRAYY